MTQDPMLACVSCGNQALLSSGLAGWAMLEDGDSALFFCGACTGDQPEATSVAGSRLVDTTAPGTPIEGNFLPVRKGDDLKNFVHTVAFGSMWFEVEKGIAMDLQTTPRESYVVSFHYNDFPSMEFRITSHSDGSATMTVPSENEMEGGPLNVYQHYRLTRMGFGEFGVDEKWTITLTPEETAPRNIGRIIAHLSLFVYDLHPNWIADVEIA